MRNGNTRAALIVLIALIAVSAPNYTIATYPNKNVAGSTPSTYTQATQTTTNVTTAKVVEESKEERGKIMVNIMVISLAGTWNCSGINSTVSSTELIYMLKPESRTIIIGEKSCLGLRALMVITRGSGLTAQGSAGSASRYVSCFELTEFSSNS